MGLENKGRRGSSYILVTGCQVSGARREKEKAQHLLEEIYSITQESDSGSRHQEVTQAIQMAQNPVIMQGKSKAFDEHFSHFSFAPFFAVSDAKPKTLFVLHLAPPHHLVTL